MDFYTLPKVQSNNTNNELKELATKEYVNTQIATSSGLPILVDESVNLGGNFYGVKKSIINTSEDIATSTVVIVPKFVVNANNLFIYKNGSLLLKGKDYLELGTSEEASTSITFMNTVLAGTEIVAISFSLHSVSGEPGPGGDYEVIPPDWGSGYGTPESPIEAYFYVNGTTGSDDNDGLTPETAFKTILKCKDGVNSFSGWANIKIYIADGTYAEPIIVSPSGFIANASKKLYFIGQSKNDTILTVTNQGSSSTTGYYQLNGSSSDYNNPAIIFQSCTLFASLYFNSTCVLFENVKILEGSTYYDMFRTAANDNIVIFKNVEINLTSSVTSRNVVILTGPVNYKMEWHLFGIVSIYPTDNAVTKNFNFIFYTQESVKTNHQIFIHENAQFYNQCRCNYVFHTNAGSILKIESGSQLFLNGSKMFYIQGTTSNIDNTPIDTNYTYNVDIQECEITINYTGSVTDDCVFYFYPYVANAKINLLTIKWTIAGTIPYKFFIQAAAGAAAVINNHIYISGCEYTLAWDIPYKYNINNLSQDSYMIHTSGEGLNALPGLSYEGKSPDQVIVD